MTFNVTFLAILNKFQGFLILFPLCIILTIQIWYQMIGLTIRNKVMLIWCPELKSYGCFPKLNCHTYSPTHLIKSCFAGLMMMLYLCQWHIFTIVIALGVCYHGNWIYQKFILVYNNRSLWAAKGSEGAWNLHCLPGAITIQIGWWLLSL